MKRVLIKPLITEKLTGIQEKENKYAFQVHPKATKKEIRKAVEELYPEVTVTNVNTMTNPGKPKGRHTRRGFIAGRTTATKKAIISIKEGQEIDFFTEI
ncbi:50S ribosomal protein L23 [Natronogracilivirga saccharolytica]|uniref:Large ribosomal subunit protein uL23 n=1 Tax=Natronogracilivirga saccharolytica TaxID=2812953 RepID=A0A8J7RM58_9BACT|nr:50S ribosomal protein L23 [Natronogracilivirga saccharolytica]MBP3192259.1 50S ribosomal protein L23 [Natronogracilivirga saccharolytica]